MPKLKVTRHHSNGDITMVNGSLYSGATFNMNGGFHLFVELEDNPDNLTTLGIVYNEREKQWEVLALANKGRVEIFKETVYNPS